LKMPQPANSLVCERGSTSGPDKQGKIISYKLINDAKGEVEFKKAIFKSDFAFQNCQWLCYISLSGNTFCNLLEDRAEHFIDSLERAPFSDSSKILLCLFSFHSRRDQA
jgi:hypothetical protein